MIATLFEKLAHASTPVLLDVAIKAFFVLALASLGTVAMRRASAAARHLVWTLALVSLLFLPLLSAVLPGWQVLPNWTRLKTGAVAPAREPARAAPEPQTSAKAIPAPPAAEPSPSTPALAPLTLEEPPTSAPVTPPVAQVADAKSETISRGTVFSVVFAVWVLGALIAMAPLLLGKLSLRLLRRTAREVTDGDCLALVDRARAQLSLTTSVTLLAGSRRSMPMIWGILRPTLLFPDDASSWTPARRWVVLLHELAHAKRRDCLTRLLAQFACAAHWFNPLAWIALARLHTESERACDDLVLTAGCDAPDYADHVLDIASHLQSDTLAAHTSIAMARPSRLEGRLLAILDSERNRSALTRLGILLAALAVAAVVLPLAGMRAAENAQSDEPTAPETDASFFKAQLPDGVTVELVGVCEHSSEGKEWWSADGAPLEGAPYESTGGTVLPNDSEQAREFAFRINGPGNATFRFSAEGSHSHVGPSKPRGPGGDYLYGMRAVASTFPADSPTSHVRLGVAAGTWTVFDSVPVRHIQSSSHATHASSHEGGGVVLHSPVETDGKTVLHLAHDLLDRDSRVVAVTDDTTVRAMSWNTGSAGGMSSVRYDFNIPLADINEFQFQTRPFHWVTFRNVSLAPGKKTDVKVVRSGVPPAVAPVVPAEDPRNERERHFVRLVIGKDRMTFEGKDTTWEELPGLLEKVPDREQTVLEAAVPSQEITVRELNNLIYGRAMSLAGQLGFEYGSYIGVHPLGSKGSAPQTVRDTQTEAPTQPISAQDVDLPTRKVVLPDVDRKPVMLDLASGEVLPIPEAATRDDGAVLSAIEALGRGDLVFDAVSLICVRGARVDLPASQEEHGAYRYDLPQVPFKTTVTTREGRRFDVTIRKADEHGCELEYTEIAVADDPAATMRAFALAVTEGRYEEAVKYLSEEWIDVWGLQDDDRAVYFSTVDLLCRGSRSERQLGQDFDRLRGLLGYLDQLDYSSLAERGKRASVFSKKQPQGRYYLLEQRGSRWQVVGSCHQFSEPARNAFLRGRTNKDSYSQIKATAYQFLLHLIAGRYEAATKMMAGTGVVIAGLPENVRRRNEVIRRAVGSRVPVESHQLYDRHFDSGQDVPSVKNGRAIVDVAGGGVLLIHADDKWVVTGIARDLSGDEYKAFLEVKSVGTSSDERASMGSQDDVSFGPIIERFVRDDGEKQDQLIDFDTGTLFSFPADFASRDALGQLAWFRETGIDAGGETGQSVRGLGCLNMTVAQVDRVLWDTPAEDLGESLLGQIDVPRSVMSAKDGTPVTFAFQTREGATGILQVLEVVDKEPRGVRIRYKLLHTGGAAATGALKSAVREVFIPDARAEAGAVLDLSDGSVRETGGKAPGEYVLSDRGDLLWDNHKLTCLRGSSLMRWNERSRMYAGKTAEFVPHLTDEFSECLLVTTPDNRHYELRVLHQIEPGLGLRIEYRLASVPVRSPQGGIASLVGRYMHVRNLKRPSLLVFQDDGSYAVKEIGDGFSVPMRETPLGVLSKDRNNKSLMEVSPDTRTMWGYSIRTDDGQPNEAFIYIRDADVEAKRFVLPLAMQKSTGGTPNAETSGENDESVQDAPWGEAVEGVQVRLRAEKTRLTTGERPTFQVFVRKAEGSEATVPRRQQNFRVDVDGRWYRGPGGARVIRAGRPTIPTGRQPDYTMFALDAQWQTIERGMPLRLLPGKHRIRVAIGLIPKGGGKPLDIISSPVEIQIVPTPATEPETIRGEADLGTVTAADVAAFHRERAGKELSHEELKRIYTEEALQQAQTGGDPHLLEEAVKRALAFDQDEFTRLQLYVFLGDAYQRQTRRYTPEEWGPQRLKAAEAYFTGLRRVLSHDLPAEPPELPAVSVYNVDGPPEVVEEYRKKHEAQVAARREAEKINELVHLRQTLTRQIVDMYAREPDAFEELRQLVLRHIGSEEAAEKMVETAKTYRTDGETAVPTIKSIARDEPPWGEAVQGVQVRLRADKPVWKSGEIPTFRAAMRNGGPRPLRLALVPEAWEVQVNGLWYRVTVFHLGGAEVLPFGSGRRHQNIPFSPEKRWGWRSQPGAHPLKFEPGKHEIRVAFTAQPRHGEEDTSLRAVRAISNPVEIEILPERGGPSFGPVIERILERRGKVTFSFVDLDTGATHKPPSPLKTKEGSPPLNVTTVELTPELIQWVRDKGIDGLIHFDGDTFGIRGFWLQRSVNPWDAWDSLTAVDAVRMFAEIASSKRSDMLTFTSVIEKPFYGVSYPFRTREGAIGILQIIEIVDKKPRGVRVRYKMAQTRDSMRGRRNASGFSGEMKDPVSERTTLSTAIDVASDEIAGTVVDSFSIPVAGASITIFPRNPGGEGWPIVTTDSNGAFRVPGFGDSWYTYLQIEAPGYAPKWITNLKVGQGFTARLHNASRLRGAFRQPDGLPAGPTVMTLVTSRKTLRARLGHTVGGIRLKLQTDAEGAFDVPLEPGTYDIQVASESGYFARHSQTKVVQGKATALPGELRPGVRFEVQAIDGLSGKPIAGETFWILEEGHGWSRRIKELGRVTDRRGMAVWDSLMPGNTSFDFDRYYGAYARWWSDQSSNTIKWKKRIRGTPKLGEGISRLYFDVKDDGDPIVIRMERNVTVTGNVVDPYGQPIPQARVNITRTGYNGTSTGDARYECQTDDDGRYTLRLPAGNGVTYNTIAADPIKGRWANAVGEPFESEPGDTFAFNLQMTAGGVVRGRVVDKRGDPIGDIEVEATPNDKRGNVYYYGRAVTDAEGRFVIAPIRSGDFTIYPDTVKDVNSAQIPRDAKRKIFVSEGRTTEVGDLIWSGPIPKRTPKASWPHEYELTVNDRGQVKGSFVDLDRGTIVTLPDELKDATGERTLRWIRENGIDATADPSSPVRGLRCFNMTVIPGENDRWDASPGRVVRFVPAKETQPQSIMSAKGGTPVTFAFQTREGAVGILQILDVVDSKPRGVRIRYKMVRPRAEADSSLPKS